jgi:hypothetical protein
MGKLTTNLPALSAHLNYEYAQLSYLAEELPRRKTDHQQIRWACLEAFLLHTRLLVDFLFFEKDDLRAGCYVIDEKKWKAQVQEKKLNTPVLEEARRYASKRVAHLTTNRLDEIEPIKYVEIARDIEVAFYEFLKMARPDLLCDQLRERQNMTEPGPITRTFATLRGESIGTSADFGISVTHFNPIKDSEEDDAEFKIPPTHA